MRVYRQTIVTGIIAAFFVGVAAKRANDASGIYECGAHSTG